MLSPFFQVEETMVKPNFVPQISSLVEILANAFPNVGSVTTIKTAKMERMNSTIVVSISLVTIRCMVTGNHYIEFWFIRC